MDAERAEQRVTHTLMVFKALRRTEGEAEPGVGTHFQSRRPEELVKETLKGIAREAGGRSEKCTPCVQACSLPTANNLK